VAQLGPQLSIVDIAEPYGRKLMMERYAPRQIAKNILDLSLDYGRLIQKLPGSTENLLRLLNDGGFAVKMEHTNLNQITSKLNIMSNRLSVAIILAAIIIGSALIMDKSSTGFINRIPLADIGFIVAVIVGLSLTYSIFKSGKY